MQCPCDFIGIRCGWPTTPPLPTLLHHYTVSEGIGYFKENGSNKLSWGNAGTLQQSTISFFWLSSCHDLQVIRMQFGAESLHLWQWTHWSFWSMWATCFHKRQSDIYEASGSVGFTQVKNLCDKGGWYGKKMKLTSKQLINSPVYPKWIHPLPLWIQSHLVVLGISLQFLNMDI